MSYFETPLKLEQITVGQSRCVTLGDAQVGIFRTKDGIYALDNLCPHRGAPLHDGLLKDGMISCPWHQWQFQLEDGICRNIPKVRIASYPIEVREGVIWVNPEDQGA